MLFNLDQSNVTISSDFNPVLEDLQANILKFHGRNFAWHLFFRLERTKKEAARNWIRHFAPSVTTAKKQLEDAQLVHNKVITDGGTVITLSLSASGYEALGKGNIKPDNPAFVHGLKGSAARLGDHVNTWEDPFKQEIDMLIIVADDDPAVALAKADQIINQASAFAVLLKRQRGNVLKMTNGVGIEHFGYADGVSQPMYLETEISRQGAVQQWDDKTNLRLVLVPDKGGKKPGETSFGSYMVFRKLEQDVNGFKEAEERLPMVKNVDGEADDELPGAMIVGRFEDGTPVINSSKTAMPAPAHPTNDFDYRDDFGLKCPFHAHVRLMNPRHGDPLAKDHDLLSHRITRRGIPFDDNPDGSKRIPDDKVSEITEEMLEDEEGGAKKGLGLLFMCYQSDIAKQFEVLQGDFANQGLTPYAPVKGQDSIITQGTDLPRALPVQWGKPVRTSNFQFSGFVKMKGGEYFFTPSVSFLASL